MALKPPRILVVDDDPEICTLLTATLRHEGFAVCAAEDGRSALEMIERCDFDLLITDIRLPPPIDGIEMVRQARKHSPGLRSLFISGAGSVRWDDPDNDDFVAKPFYVRELVGCVWELLSRPMARV
jgi:DNA-binding response OmpR family regulator